MPQDRIVGDSVSVRFSPSQDRIIGNSFSVGFSPSCCGHRGAGEDGQLGLGNDCRDEQNLQLIPSLVDKHVSTIVAGSRDSLAITATGQVGHIPGSPNLDQSSS